jgi:hypothetical protein
MLFRGGLTPLGDLPCDPDSAFEKRETMNPMREAHLAAQQVPPGRENATIADR